VDIYTAITGQFACGYVLH